jgi:hypothetical protein
MAKFRVTFRKNGSIIVNAKSFADAEKSAIDKITKIGRNLEGEVLESIDKI